MDAEINNVIYMELNSGPKIANSTCGKTIIAGTIDRDSTVILNSVRQHNYFITQGNYIGYMFQLEISHLQAYFCHLSHRMLCTRWDPIVFTSMEYVKLNHLSQKV